MDVVAVAVVGGAQGDDGLEARWSARRNLQTIKATPRDAHHANLARAPGLLHQPGDHGLGVGQLLFGIFVKHDAVRVTVAAHVHPHAGIPMSCQVGVCQGIAHDGAVALAIGQVFKHCRHRVFIGIFWQPQPCSKLGTVGQGNQDVGDFADLARKRFDCLHGAGAFFVVCLIGLSISESQV